MTQFRARISRVRMKAGGADLTIIDGFIPPPDDESVAATFHRASRELVEDGDLTSFVMVGFRSDGAVWFSHRYTPDCPIARTLIPAYVEELTRRYVLTSFEAEQRFGEMFEWVE